MAILYFIAVSTPFWAIPLGLILLEQANRKRLLRQKVPMWTAIIVALMLFAISGFFIYIGGYKEAIPAFFEMRREYNI